MTLILAIDASTGPCSVALLRGEELLAERFEPRNVAQSRVLVPMMQDVMREASMDYKQLVLIVGTTGPGSFTGIRIGLGMARAAGLAAGVPVRGVSCFEVLALQEAADATVACAINAGKGEVYLQSFDASLAPLHEPLLLPFEDAAKQLPKGCVLCGNAAEVLNSGHAVGKAQHPQARDAALFAARYAARLSEPAPLYIRPPDAIIPARPATAC